ncbi:MAG: hypothetical protein P1P90_06595 [Patescibacteria group bacterium]|nr:hypothetical protein [Patescibacteria group bacterium]
MNEREFVPKPEEIAPTLKSPDDPGLPYAETLKSSAQPYSEKEAISQLGTLRSTEASDAPIESGIREKNPDSISVVGTAPISSEVLSEEAYPMEEVLEPSEKSPEGFKLHEVPEWEIKARGTVPTPETAGAPNMPSEIEKSNASSIEEFAKLLKQEALREQIEADERVTMRSPGEEDEKNAA